MIDTWITTPLAAAGMVVSTAIGIYLALIVFTRLAGLRSFAKMSSFDFAMTVAIGSLVASTILTKSPALLQAVVALAAIYLLQIGLAALRERSKWIERLVDNEPILLMEGDQVLDDNLRRAKVTRSDLRAKLREANVLDLDQVRAVVMETTGDVSVLHASSSDQKLHPALLDGVRGADAVRAELLKSEGS